MKSLKRFAVIGYNGGGLALAARLALHGHPVSLCDWLHPGPDFARLRAAREIEVTGAINGRCALDCVTDNLPEAVAGAETILITSAASQHRAVFTELWPNLRDGQTAVLLPGNFGGILFRQMLGRHSEGPDIAIAEAASLPDICEVVDYRTVFLRRQKQSLKLATHPVGQNAAVLAAMNKIIDIFIPAGNILEASLENINSILHPLPVLLNAGLIEREGKSFRHFVDGITPTIARLMAKMDAERMAIGRAYGLNLMPALDQLKMYYGDNDSQDFLEYVNDAASPYREIVGQSLNSRYITEDVPYLVVPALALAGRAGVQAPLHRLCAQIASEISNQDYLTSGYDLASLGLDRATPQELIAFCG